MAHPYHKDPLDGVLGCPRPLVLLLSPATASPELRFGYSGHGSAHLPRESRAAGLPGPGSEDPHPPLPAILHKRAVLRSSQPDSPDRCSRSHRHSDICDR